MMGDRIADRVTALVGSWRFLLLHALWWGVWLPTSFFGHDPFPFGLLTMILSLEAIVLGTMVLISQNRAADRDRAMLRRQSEEVDELDTLEREDVHLIRDMHAMLTAMQVAEPSKDNHPSHP